MIGLSPSACRLICVNLVYLTVSATNCITDLVPTIWRFLPAVDPLVDEFHSRDLDSLVSQREFDAVNEFRNWKNAQFHIMRDHKMHSAPILGNTKMHPLCLSGCSR